MTDPTTYFRQAAAAAYAGQLQPAFQSALAAHFADVAEADCAFVHAVDLGGGRSIDGVFDLRGIEDAQLGDTPVWGRRVLEIGPATGWLSAHLALRADELVVLDTPPPETGTPAAADTAARIRNGWWFLRAALGFDALVAYAPPGLVPADLGRFDVAVIGASLAAAADPYAVLRAAAAVTDETIVLALPWRPAAGLSPDVPALHFVGGDAEDGGGELWRIAPAAALAMLARLGFGQQTVTAHPVPGRDGAVLHYVVAATRPPAGAAVAAPDLPAALRAGAASASAGTAVASTGASAGASAAASAPLQPPAPHVAAQPPGAPAPAAQGLPPVDLAEIAADDLPLPTARGRFLVAGTEDVEVFVILGRAGYGAIQSTLRRSGIDTRSLGRVLDFGCGVGRVLRYWKAAPAVEMHGTDLNPDAVAWCRENLTFAQFTTNRLEPHLDYPDNHFGLVYALSVFTHLPEEMQVPWLAELKRIVRPGGHVYFTTHGVSYRAALPPPMRAQFDADQLVGGGNDAGSNYYGTFHPASYVRRAMLDPLRLALIDFEPEGAKGNPTQDSWLVRKS